MLWHWMRVMVGGALLMGFAWAAAAAEGEKAQLPLQDAPSTAGPASALDCGRCHACDNPTGEDRCLKDECTRPRRWTQVISLPEYEGPDVVVLDELEDVYMPVPFDHKGHADMAAMAGGCMICHHYTPTGQQHPACKTCHAIASAEADIDKPGLRGAYHQQCLNCHREWINERDCDVCHPAKGQETERAAGSATKDDILGRIHPPIPEPDGDLYRPSAQRPQGWQVVFRHGEHVTRFGLKCVECHHERSCARCHDGNGKRERRVTLAEHHDPCLRCHKGDMDLQARESGRCERCHWRERQPKPMAFNHAGTGWPLSRYHEGVGCRQCHPKVPFERLDRTCNACHGGWAPGAFDHQVTGQGLDENHVELDCEVCHTDRKFDRSPACDGCHEADDGVTFPARRPGPMSGRRVP